LCFRVERRNVRLNGFEFLDQCRARFRRYMVLNKARGRHQRQASSMFQSKLGFSDTFIGSVWAAFHRYLAATDLQPALTLKHWINMLRQTELPIDEIPAGGTFFWIRNTKLAKRPRSKSKRV
jgi:hypothetical protein